MPALIYHKIDENIESKFPYPTKMIIYLLEAEVLTRQRAVGAERPTTPSSTNSGGGNDIYRL